METCSYSERLLPAFLDGELDGPLRREVASHVAGCLVCTRESTSLEQIQDLIRHQLDEELERVDFSGFIDGVMDRVDDTALSPTSLTSISHWTVRFQLWRETWRLGWLPQGTGWTAATAAIAVAFGLFSLISFEPSTDRVASSQTGEEQVENWTDSSFEDAAPLELAMDDQAHIESLTASTTVFLWNEPVSNATIIWVGDPGGMP